MMLKNHWSLRVERDEGDHHGTGFGYSSAQLSVHTEEVIKKQSNALLAVTAITCCNNYCNLHADLLGSNNAASTASAGTKRKAIKSPKLIYRKRDPAKPTGSTVMLTQTTRDHRTITRAWDIRTYAKQRSYWLVKLQDQSRFYLIVPKRVVQC
jgi:hypothetical protein